MTKEEREEILTTYKWINVKRFDPLKYPTLEERYNALVDHHEKETMFLINKVREVVNETAS